MQGPIGLPGSLNSFTHIQKNRTNVQIGTLYPPVHSQSLVPDNKTIPPILAPSSSEPENLLPLSETNDHRGAISMPPPPPAQTSGEELQSGELIWKVEPIYPPAAIELRVEGTVKMDAVIGENGSIKRVRALSGPHELIPAALEAVRQWHYSPTLQKGQPVQITKQITVMFQLARPTPK
jgi:protein TonB